MKNKIIELQNIDEFWSSKKEYKTMIVVDLEQSEYFKNSIIETDFFEKLIGNKIVNIYVKNRNNINDNPEIVQLIFELENDIFIRIFHEQECCEYVRLYDISGGSLEDLIGGTIGRFDWSSSSETETDITDEQDIQNEYFTWTFYRIATEKVFLTLRWLGESNGCYSEEMMVTVKNLK